MTAPEIKAEEAPILLEVKVEEADELVLPVTESVFH